MMGKGLLEKTEPEGVSIAKSDQISLKPEDIIRDKEDDHKMMKSTTFKKI